MLGSQVGYSSGYEVGEVKLHKAAGSLSCEMMCVKEEHVELQVRCSLKLGCKHCSSSEEV